MADLEFYKALVVVASRRSSSAAQLRPMLVDRTPWTPAQLRLEPKGCERDCDARRQLREGADAKHGGAGGQDVLLRRRQSRARLG